MSRNREYEKLVSRVKEMRAKIRKEVEDELALKSREAEAEGQFLWENNWVTPGESRELQHKLKIRDRVVFFELAVVTLFIGFSSYALYFMMRHFLLPR